MTSEYEPLDIPGGIKPEIRDRSNNIVKDLKGYEGRCLFVIDHHGKFCNEPVRNNCHVSPRAAILDHLKDPGTGMLIELEWGVGQWLPFLQREMEPDSIPLRQVSPYDACVGWFACKKHQHDDDFMCIDKAHADFKEPKIGFLAAYRLALFQVDQYRLGKHLQKQKEEREQKQANRAARRSNDLWKESKQVTKDIDEWLQRGYSVVTELGKNWHALKTTGKFNPNLASVETVRFRSKLHLAGCVNYREHVGVSVYPIDGDLHEMALLSWAGGSSQAQSKSLMEVAQASESSSDYDIAVALELIRTQWLTLAASPESYYALGDEHRSNIMESLALPARLMQRRVRALRQSAGSKPRWG